MKRQLSGVDFQRIVAVVYEQDERAIDGGLGHGAG
jgi:hypothetical protein